MNKSSFVFLKRKQTNLTVFERNSLEIYLFAFWERRSIRINYLFIHFFYVSQAHIRTDPMITSYSE